MTATDQEALLAKVRELRSRTDLVGAELRAALVAAVDVWLQFLFHSAGAPRKGVALVAVGGFGRMEPAPGSDLDLLLIHSGSIDVTKVADRIWYPIWDSGIGLDHSVRTVGQTLAIADDDLKAVLGLLDIRHVAGDAELAEVVREQVLHRWRSRAMSRLPELKAACVERNERFGELAYLLEPDLKESRGGLRDLHALNAIAAAQLGDPPRGQVAVARDLLLDVRGELHRLQGAHGRPSDRLRLQDQDAIAATLSYADADQLMAAVYSAGRSVMFTLDEAWRRVLPSSAAGGGRRLFGSRKPAVREPLAPGVVEQNGEVVLARHADPIADPSLVFRVAAAAARSGLPLAPITRARLAAIPNLPSPWPPEALDAFIRLLGAGHAMIPVMESLDQSGILVRLLPEWENVRCKPQRNAYHRFTVDRHLLEAAANAAALTRKVHRPDLLLLGGLLHDIGKGRPGDHTEIGIALVAEIGPALGLPPDDVAVLQQLVRHHLLLPDVATRRDLDDPATATAISEAVGDRSTLELLHALTEADGLATGPAAWSEWKAGLVADLVRRTSTVFENGEPPPPKMLTDAQRALIDTGDLALVADIDGGTDTLTVVYPDTPGVLATLAGVLALHRVDIRSLDAVTEGEVGLVTVRTALRYGSQPDWVLVRDDLCRAIEGRLDVADLLAARAAAYAPAQRAAPPQVLWVDGASQRASVLELRCPDAVGLLFRAASALTRSGMDVSAAFCTTIGADVVDSFYVTTASGDVVEDPGLRRSVEEEVLAAVGSAPAE